MLDGRGLLKPISVDSPEQSLTQVHVIKAVHDLMPVTFNDSIWLHALGAIVSRSPFIFCRLDSTLCGSLLHTANMDLKVIVVFALMAVVIHAPVSNAKPISLVERCWCRSTVNTVPQRSIRELKFLHTPNCPFQVIAKLKSNKEVCINPETKWLQQYLKNALNKMKKAQQQSN